MRNACMFVVAALALGGCRLFMPSATATATPEQREADQAEKDADAAMARWNAAQADFDQAAAALKVAIDKAKAYEEEAKKADAERAMYGGAIAAARDAARGCSGGAELIAEIHRVLVEYVAEPQRDAAISGLEPCRKAAAKTRKAELDRALPGQRKEYVATLQARFDEQNPEHKGQLVGKIKGEALDVEAVKFTGWDAARSQSEVDGWCAETSTFSAISLRSAGGKFTCRPKEAPKDYTARLLRESGLMDAWVPVPSGAKKPPPAESAEEEAKIEALSAEMDAAGKRLEAAEVALDAAEAEGEAAVENFTEKVKAETEH